jgi:L-alanine-DL-glutamate epimerase-like enolase superfamily enzyme
VSTFDAIADLPLTVEGYELEGMELDVSSDFTRLTTIIHMQGAGEEGVGEDVTYDALDHVALQDAGPVLDLAHDGTLGEFCDRVGGMDLFPTEPVRDVSSLYRRWAVESAALDLALRQSGTSLAAALGREARPVTFVVSLRLGEPATVEPVTRRLERYPSLRFKLDPTPSWTRELIDQLVELGCVDSLDLKGHYKGTVVDNPTDPALYRRLVAAFPDAWLEDPDVNDQTRDILEPVRDRLTWDAPIHSIADIESLPWPSKMVNIKPSRVGGLRDLFGMYDFCAQNGIGAYGGGQFELGVGRGHIQYLASIFHADTPNDTSPSGYHVPDPPPGLPSSPLPPGVAATGFRWEG